MPLIDNLISGPDASRAMKNYRRLAKSYDGTCTRIADLRRRALVELDLQPGETVLDIACGTGSVLADLAAAVAPTGTVIGVELSPEMAALARGRVASAGLFNRVRIIEGPVEALRVAQTADALLLCYTHDVLQSPAAIDRLLASAKPDARIVVLGMRALPWLWGWPVNLFNLYRARCYLTTYRNMRRPYRLLEQQGATLREVHSALWGSAYIASGTLRLAPARYRDA